MTDTLKGFIEQQEKETEEYKKQIDRELEEFMELADKAFRSNDLAASAKLAEFCGVSPDKILYSIDDVDNLFLK